MYSRKYVCMFIYLFIFNDVTICKMNVLYQYIIMILKMLKVSYDDVIYDFC